MIRQKFDHKAKRVLFVGTSGTGKTELLEKHVRAEKARIKFIFDHQGEIADRWGLPACVDVEGFYRGLAIGGWVCFDPVKICQEVTGREKDGTPIRLGLFRSCELVMQIFFECSQQIGGRKILVFDEIQRIYKSTCNPAELQNILETGRRWQIDVFGVSQAPNLIHNSIRAQMRELYSFRLTEDNALKFLSQNGFDETKIRLLPDGKYVWRNTDSGESGEGGTAF